MFLADNASVNYGSNEAPSLHNPITLSDFGERLFYPIVTHSLMSILNYEGSELVPSGQKDRVLGSKRDIGML